IQGVQTPFSWSVWNHGMEVSTRLAFGKLGILDREEVPVPGAVSDRMSGIFYGRAAGNVNFFRALGDRMPGGSADVLEQKVFGEVSGTSTLCKPGGIGRAAQIAWRFPLAAFRSTGLLRAMLAEHHHWWRASVFDNPPTTLEGAQRLMREGAERFAAADVEHAIVSMLVPQFLESLTALADRATGQPELGMNLATGFGGMEETRIITDVWRAARGEVTLQAFLAEHGFHGPNEGRLDTHSWREDPAPVRAMIAGYTERGTRDPREREREQTALREATARRVKAGLPATRRGAVGVTMKLAKNFLIGREIGKAAFLHGLDGARCGARVAGRILTERGLLEDPEDIFFLTLEEATGPPTAAFAGRAAERKANHERYLRLELPPAWDGRPAATEHTTAAAGTASNGARRVTELNGIGVVGGKVTGRARVVADPTTADFEPGDILVCAMTDP